MKALLVLLQVQFHFQGVFFVYTIFVSAVLRGRVLYPTGNFYFFSMSMNFLLYICPYVKYIANIQPNIWYANITTKYLVIYNYYK